MRNPSKSKKTVHIIEAELSLAGHRLTNVHYFHLFFFVSYEGPPPEANRNCWSLIGARDNKTTAAPFNPLSGDIAQLGEAELLSRGTNHSQHMLAQVAVCACTEFSG